MGEAGFFWFESVALLRELLLGAFQGHGMERAHCSHFGHSHPHLR